jgi:hypothetical protein
MCEANENISSAFLNMVSKNLVLTAIHSTKTCGRRFAASASLAVVTGNGVNEVAMRVVIQNNAPAPLEYEFMMVKSFSCLMKCSL